MRTADYTAACFASSAVVGGSAMQCGLLVSQGRSGPLGLWWPVYLGHGIAHCRVLYDQRDELGPGRQVAMR